MCLIVSCFRFCKPQFKKNQMSDKPKSIYVQKSGQIEVKNKQGFQSCAAYDFNSLIFNENDGEGSSIELTVGDSFNTCDISDVDEWLTERPDVSRIDFYAVNENVLDEDNGIRFSDDLSSSDIEGYCVIDNFCQFRTLVTRNITNEFQPITEVTKTENLKNDSSNVLQCPQQIIAVCTSNDACNITPVQNISNRPKQSVSMKDEKDIYSDHFLSSVDSQNELEYNSVRIGKDFELVNLNKSFSALSKSVSNRSRPSSNNNNSTGLPFVKLPKKYILSGKIINQNMLPLLRNRNPMIFASRPIDLKKNSMHSNQKIQKGKSVLKYNGVKSNVNSQESEQCVSEQPNEQFILPTSVGRLSNRIESVEIDSSSDSKRNINIKKSNTPLAVVAISTNKSDDTTEIVIKTEKGEELYKGKTSEMMKATKNNYIRSNLFVDKNYNSSSKIGNNMNDGKLYPPCLVRTTSMV